MAYSYNAMLTHGDFRAKYPLAVINYTLNAICCKDLGLASDIGCALRATIARSARVGPLAREWELDVFVNAFHGWKHCRKCQCRFHPLYRMGVGLEDFEGMERVFSASNAVARCVRLASHYHWMQAYDLHFRQWDEDKYTALSKHLLTDF